MTGVEFDVIGEDIAARNLFDMGQRALDPRPALRKVRDMLTRGHAKQFASKGGYLGETWPPIAASTAERKGSDEIGVDSGRLKAALMGGSGRKTSVTRKQVTVGVSPKLFYARFFSRGTETQPARAIVGATEGELRAANWLIRRYITQGHA